MCCSLFSLPTSLFCVCWSFYHCRLEPPSPFDCFFPGIFILIAFWYSHAWSTLNTATLYLHGFYSYCMLYIYIWIFGIKNLNIIKELYRNLIAGIKFNGGEKQSNFIKIRNKKMLITLYLFSIVSEVLVLSVRWLMGIKWVFICRWYESILRRLQKFCKGTPTAEKHL